MTITADFFDGKHAGAQVVMLAIANDQLSITSGDQTVNTQLSLKSCTIQPALGQSRRIIELPDGGHLSLSRESFEALIPARHKSTFWRKLHAIENNLGLVAIALIAVIALSVAFVRWGVPALAYTTAKLTPLSVEQTLGQQALDAMDEPKVGYFKPSQSSLLQQKQISQHLASMCKKTQQCPTYTLHFRQSRPSIGANAFALPGGQVVITDDLIKLANNNDEIISVLAHELGHVKERHALRGILQSTISGLLIVMLTGDFSSLAASIPTAMLHLQYTRNLENEADHYALQSMLTACIPTGAFADMLTRLDKNAGKGLALPELLSSHPDTAKRVQPFIDANATCL